MNSYNFFIYDDIKGIALPLRIRKHCLHCQGQAAAEASAGDTVTAAQAAGAVDLSLLAVYQGTSVSLPGQLQ